MKALLSRFRKDKDRDQPVLSATADAGLNREKPELPPLKSWPPQFQGRERTASINASLSSNKPLPELRPLPLIDHSSISLLNNFQQASSESSSSTSIPAPPTSSTTKATSSTPVPRSEEKLAESIVTVTRTELPRRDTIESVAPSTTPAVRSARKHTDSSATSSDAVPDTAIGKKVAFISPPSTPAPFQRSLSDPNPTHESPAEQGTIKDPASASNAEPATSPKSNPTGPLKTSITRFQAAHGSEARGSTGTASSSKTGVSPKTSNASAHKATTTSTRTAITSLNPHRHFADNASTNFSLRSATPYSHMSQASSRMLSNASWSEAAEDELVLNLGARERTRQEVLWEIVASEERYVLELKKMKDGFIDPLLHPYAAPPSLQTSPTPYDNDEYYARVESPRESIDHLPIAQRFLSPTPGPRSETPATTRTAKDSTPNIDGDSAESDDDEALDQVGKGYSISAATNGAASRRIPASAIAVAVAKFEHSRSPYMSPQRGNAGKPSYQTRSHQSLPPVTRQPPQESTASFGRQSFTNGSGRDREKENLYAMHQTQQSEKTSSRVLKKLRRSTVLPEVLAAEYVAPNQLPEDLRKCLEVLENGIFDGHIALFEGLRKRYEQQYPLVRSLADVFIESSHILREYATYVLHLERALEQVDNALSTACEKKKPKNQDAAAWMKICQRLQKLEQEASDNGETGLAISLSKPFQRLLKYPLLFQNLLYHTDPSTFEFESTLDMVGKVEDIVRSIEDEKIQKEQRDKTRDVFARIEGLDKVKQVALPKPSRVLVEERPVEKPSSTQTAPSAMAVTPSKNVKGRTSFRRLSDVLAGQSSMGGKKDQWFVIFNDVVLRCQRVGVTTLPLASSTSSTTPVPELQGKGKVGNSRRRTAHTKPRNLYKFLKIETWDIAGVPDPRQGVVSMEDVVRSRETMHSSAPSGRASVLRPQDEDDGNESSDSDRRSKMSFSYWGADKVTLHKPLQRGGSHIMTSRKSPLVPLGYGRDLNAKFGTRLINQENPHHHLHQHPRSASRRTQATPSSRRAPYSEDGHSSARSTITPVRPAWDGSTRTRATTPIPSKRSRVQSQTSAAGTRSHAHTKALASPVPSEDSGVGLYRQLMAQDSQLNVV